MDSPATPQSDCFTLIVALKYEMAGDMESIELLRQLEERYRSINWSDPHFVEITKEMRAGLPDTSKTGIDAAAIFRNLLHYQPEKQAAEDEAIRALAPAVIRQAEQLTASLQLVFDLLRIIAGMKRQIEAQGVDASRYQVSWPPILGSQPNT